ncbi:hypothetical protein E2C01_090139 [Portunus trituberculatus]|uniref:Uncharacterized protein n=1 Tax=Portunus trituberculatus TaxID=210409 RepID=A0A5B7JPA5_PORTR|nr:hypothetical protein [Portunus trituberculatus]
MTRDVRWRTLLVFLIALEVRA